jgi:large subunit ribosomal protein L5
MEQKVASAEAAKKDSKAAPRLLARYRSEVRPALAKRFGYKNLYQAPCLLKIVVNMGVGQGAADIKVVEQAALELGLITGQRPVLTRAKKAISNFKIREGQPIGVKVTLRRRRMYEFMDRLVSVAMPRIRDFRGVSPAGFDGGGNYAFGITEQLIFPEVDYDKVKRVQGMDIIFCTSAKTPDEAYELLRLMAIPFREKS